mmetsp:Transcript_27252/g.59136  ORF Transcript_27252/g.59136 Transcript_27252/m.59136 type:complete len:132 (-) Transcript_27252:226-621(-)
MTRCCFRCLVTTLPFPLAAAAALTPALTGLTHALTGGHATADAGSHGSRAVRAAGDDAGGGGNVDRLHRRRDRVVRVAAVAVAAGSFGVGVVIVAAAADADAAGGIGGQSGAAGGGHGLANQGTKGGEEER